MTVSALGFEVKPSPAPDVGEETGTIGTRPPLRAGSTGPAQRSVCPSDTLPCFAQGSSFVVKKLAYQAPHQVRLGAAVNAGQRLQLAGGAGRLADVQLLFEQGSCVFRLHKPKFIKGVADSTLLRGRPGFGVGVQLPRPPQTAHRGGMPATAASRGYAFLVPVSYTHLTLPTICSV